ncbi:MAG: flagellar FlbD family protein [Leptospira sp.]|nr:flagellar FlbD family protein [Leptospira sp.]
MIVVHRLNKSEILINANLIESIEANPDTVITMTNDRKYIIRENVSELMDKIIDYHKKVFQFPFKITGEKEI